MKTLILTAVVLVSATPAFAMHAYSDIQCKARLPNGQTLELGSSSGSYEFQILEKGQPNTVDQAGAVNPVILTGSKLEPNTPEVAVLSLAVTKEKRVSSKSSMEDACWKDTTTAYQSDVTVAGILPATAKALGLKFNDTLKLTCIEEVTAPEGKCD